MDGGSGPTDERPPDDDAVVSIDASLSWQADYCVRSGSPIAAELVGIVADDIAVGGAAATLQPPTVRYGDFIGLRVMAVLHRLALSRAYPTLGIYFPTMGGTAPTTPTGWAGLREHVLAALAQHPEAVLAGIARIPQTNEVGRAAQLRCALSYLGPRSPVRLLEIGASAGLNLRADHLPGDPTLEFGPLPEVIERRGCDLDPVDISSEAGRLWLSSFVWVDDVERFERLKHALAVAAQVPATLVRSDAVDFLDGVDLVEGSTTVLWQSAMWPYLPATTREALLTRIAVLGGSASARAPFAHITWERRTDAVQPELGFGLTVRHWNGVADGRPHLLAVGVSHGSPSQRAGKASKAGGQSMRSTTAGDPGSQMIDRVQVEPPLPPFAHISQLGRHVLSDRIHASFQGVSQVGATHGVSAVARSKDWTQTRAGVPGVESAVADVAPATMNTPQARVAPTTEVRRIFDMCTSRTNVMSRILGSPPE